jgi:membrane associated rhomboid family serine protease
MLMQEREYGVVGASGAVYGILAAFAFLFPNTRLMLLFPPIPVKAKYLVAALIAFDLFSGISGQGTGIAHFAHIGGAIFGFLTLLFWRKMRR